jgi:hypothetical protein
MKKIKQIRDKMGLKKRMRKKDHQGLEPWLDINQSKLCLISQPLSFILSLLTMKKIEKY